MFAKNVCNSENTRPRLAIAKKPAGNQESATQPFVPDQGRSFKQMHGRRDTVCNAEAMYQRTRKKQDIKAGFGMPASCRLISTRHS